MNLALMQAHKVIGNTGKNPAVGCVLIKNDCVISSGFTGFKGRPHAEQSTLKLKKKLLANANLYVTLEPCSHYGVTPPCVNIIINKKINKVFFSVRDPDVRSFNKSSIKLRKNKVKTSEGILKNKINKFYKSYFKFKLNKIPYVTAKIAVSKDYFTKNKKNKWITNIFSRGRVHLLRSMHDCILTSVRTVLDDNPRLTCRINGMENRSPTRIILDKRLEIPMNSKIITSVKKYPSIIFFQKYNKRKIHKLRKLNVKMIRCNKFSNSDFDLRNILVKIRKLGFSRVFLETGLTLTTSFLRKNLIDDFKIFISNKKLNKSGSKNFKSIMRSFFVKKKFEIEKINLFGDSLISYRMK